MSQKSLRRKVNLLFVNATLFVLTLIWLDKPQFICKYSSRTPKKWLNWNVLSNCVWYTVLSTFSMNKTSVCLHLYCDYGSMCGKFGQRENWGSLGLYQTSVTWLHLLINIYLCCTTSSQHGCSN